mmetsp:Transcript_13109/g.37727  ORF Transcript_13109/g.37727 Transcript_13109/m.37727 type:complete len:180 (+) Transcript_13109:105-644(+)
MPRKYKVSIDLTLKESHEGYHTLTKIPPTVGYSQVTAAERKRSSPTTTGAGGPNQGAMLAKKKAQAMSLASKPGQQVMMNAFMMYMSGSTLNIFSISTTSTAIITPITSIFKMESMFANFEEVDTQIPKLIYVALNLVWLPVGMYKLSAMRLLPTTSADWADSIVWKDMTEMSSIPPAM